MAKFVYCCWDCDKEYPISIAVPFEQRNKLVLCTECGGQVISNSGKVMLRTYEGEDSGAN